MIATESKSLQLAGLGAWDAATAALPTLRMRARNGRNQTVGDVSIQLVALATRQYNVAYFEGTASSTSEAHAILGALSGLEESKVSWEFKTPDSDSYYGTTVKMPEDALYADTRLGVSGGKTVHHVAMADRNILLHDAKNPDALWRAVRDKLTCPTLPEWGKQLIARMFDRGALVKCESFGLPPHVVPCVLGDEALCDRLVCEMVKERGL